ncbi:response regulator transcription factor [Sedimentibacter hydroxybenzoicus DSM 7310]|uniref:Response regulator transcription factor n=1 Tax=Sedimentibacter hydroxybenzoicus DSM 7310 TaxID=1123245 RepID=A0A974GYA7_SEDHY|nr:response regulator transcription factor [Sedimentibacter hydroxybenzoicus]NYB76071.1 response regulator transcription factor [Sedimentibacter hydroxybenzoicus DSM 7310]
MKLIYCVEDDAGIRELITLALSTADFEVMGFEEAGSFYNALRKRIPDLILLDLMLPKIDGMSIMKTIKSDLPYAEIPIIILTAKSMELDKVKGLESGADDFITKPFGVLELMARVKAVLRRSGKKEILEDIIEYKDLILDYNKRTLLYKDIPVVLTYKEFELLYYLMLNKGIVLSRDKILQEIWGYDYEGETRTVDMHIKTIRQKLDAAGCPNYVVTVRSAGYKLEEQQ